MIHEFESYAFIDGERDHVTVCYELDGYKPIGLWVVSGADADITCIVQQDEYDRLYEEACQHAVEGIHCAAETYYEGER